MGSGLFEQPFEEGWLQTMERHWTNMFVRVSDDCPAETGVIPPQKRAEKSAHLIQYELLSENPYCYTFEEQLFEVHIRHKALLGTLSEVKLEEERAALLAKSHPCMRASMLPKKFGWGVHYNDEGKIALYGKETEKYQNLLKAGEAGELELQAGMRSSRAKG
jgi:hypothetical protein